MGKEDLLIIGKIVGVHGIMGNVKVYSYSESISIFEAGNSILVIDAEGLEKIFVIESVKPHKNILLLSLTGIYSRAIALPLKGSEIFTEKSKLPDAGEDEYYWFDLIGLSIFTLNGEFLGKIDSIITTGSNDVYDVKNSDNIEKSELLIPALESVVLNIDLEHGKMIVDLPEGL
ncbi:MAG: 16S rRNA processing protein RimM [Deltaproteobacteria bacterium]|nr:16S rRNA processing protein RimM [Deltaproteobacteria bacterium]